MNTKIIAIMVVGAIVIGGGSFYAGTKFTGNNNDPRRDFAQMDQDGTPLRVGQNGGPGMRTEQVGGMIVGEILSKDDTSITMKLPDGESKVVFFSENTMITKNAAGSSDDLVVSESVVVNGTVNSDGSITAQLIQLDSGMQGFRQGQSPSTAN